MQDRIEFLESENSRLREIISANEPARLLSTESVLRDRCFCCEQYLGDDVRLMRISRTMHRIICPKCAEVPKNKRRLVNTMDKLQLATAQQLISDIGKCRDENGSFNNDVKPKVNKLIAVLKDLLWR